MKFHEHIIRASVPELPIKLTREDLATGIADFARHPDRYINEADASRITRPEKHEDTGSVVFGREICFGKLHFEETIHLFKDGTYVAHIEGDTIRPASKFTMKIEEPEDGVFFVRFIYDEDGEPAKKESVQEQRISALRRMAYESKDRDVLSKILENIVRDHMENETIAPAQL